MAYVPVQADALAWAGFATSSPPFAGAHRPTGARRAGLHYEKLAHEHLEASYPAAYLRSPWLVYGLRGSQKVHWCQPDGLLFDFPRQLITIVEIKLHHTADAYWQVMEIYLPVLRYIFSGRPWEFRQVEVVRWFDPAIHFPVNPAMASDPAFVPRARFGVHIWKRDRGTN